MTIILYVYYVFFYLKSTIQDLYNKSFVCLNIKTYATVSIRHTKTTYLLMYKYVACIEYVNNFFLNQYLGSSVHQMSSFFFIRM